MSATITDARRDWVERVLGVRIPGGATAPDVTPQGATEGAKVAFAKLKLEWNGAKAQVKSQLEALHRTVLAEYASPEVAKDAEKILRITGKFNEGLGDTLDDLYNAADATAQQRLREQARSIASHYEAYVDGDKLLAHVDANPFVTTTVRTLLSTPLRKLLAQLAA